MDTPCAETEGLSEISARFSSCPSTAGMSEYYSARCEAMIRSEGQFSDSVTMEIEFSKSHWSEVSGVEGAPQSEELNRENREVLEQLREEHPALFWHDLDGFVLGRMIARGGQAEIYEVKGRPDRLMKVFQRGTSLRELRGSCPLPVLKEAIHQCILLAGMLDDGRFAFVMYRHWGDLRKLIDQAMQEKNANGIQGPPFPYKWKDYERWTFYSVDFMLEIAKHMRNLHYESVTHRDLKASNILLVRNFGLSYGSFLENRGIVVADFECSIGVLGTGFWRAPEILASLGKQETITNEQWKKADVYSYGMTCFEIVTGRIPFEGELENTRGDRQLVIEGRRPELPSDLDVAVKDLIIHCWEPNPSLRPTFVEIVKMVEMISTKLCEFRVLVRGHNCPLATIQEVNDYPLALMKAMPKYGTANLANGSISGYHHGMKISSERRSDVSYELARVPHGTHPLIRELPRIQLDDTLPLQTGSGEGELV